MNKQLRTHNNSQDFPLGRNDSPNITLIVDSMDRMDQRQANSRNGEEGVDVQQLFCILNWDDNCWFIYNANRRMHVDTYKMTIMDSDVNYDIHDNSIFEDRTQDQINFGMEGF